MIEGIYLRTLLAFHTYEEWLMGWPQPEKLIERARKKAGEIASLGEPVWVIDPPRIEHPATKAGRLPPRIPDWTFIAALDGPPSDSHEAFSSLTLVWFGPSFEFDFAEPLSKFDWATHAKDGSP